jgi:tetratricopeptide (TPR) repeat protein
MLGTPRFRPVDSFQLPAGKRMAMTDSEQTDSVQGATAFVPASRSGSFQSSDRQTLVLGLLLFVASLALYSPVGRHPFVNYDDDRYVSDNAHVRDGFSWESVKWAFTSYDESNWHPVTWLSHMLDCQLFHLNPAGHHYTNAVLHALNVVLLFWILYSATGFVWQSSMVAALFALHPINVESVAWVAERKNVLSLFFFLLALGAYRWYVIKPRIGRYSVVAAVFTLGLMAKPQVVTLPFVLLLWDHWPLQRTASSADGSGAKGEVIGKQPLPTQSWLWLTLEKVPLLALCAVSSMLTLKAQNAAGAVTSLNRYPLSIRLDNAVVAYARYVGKALWPSNLSVMYPYQPASLSQSQILLSLLFLVLITAGVVAAGKKRYLTVGWLWFLGTLVPMIGIIQVGVQSIADRYAYLPFIGFFLAACWGAAEFAKNLSFSLKWLVAASTVLLAVLAFVSYRQIGYWSSNLSLWSHAAAVTTNNFVAEDGIGNSLLERGDLEQAMPHFQIAAEIHPSDPISNSNLAFYKMQHGDLPGALAQYKTVIESTYDERSKANALINTGNIEDDLGNLSAARDSFQGAVNLRPRNVRAWIGLGLATQRLKDYDAAVQAYSHAVSLQPSDLTYLLLAGALKQSDRGEAAAAATQSAVHLSQDITQTQEFVNKLLAH